MAPSASEFELLSFSCLGEPSGGPAHLPAFLLLVNLATAEVPGECLGSKRGRMVLELLSLLGLLSLCQCLLERFLKKSSSVLCRREDPHDAVVFHPKHAGKTLSSLPEKR